MHDAGVTGFTYPVKKFKEEKNQNLFHLAFMAQLVILMIL